MNQPKKGKGKNSGKLPGEVVQIDLIMLEWFYQKIPFNELVSYFNVCEGTLTRLIKHYGFSSDKELLTKRRSDKTSERTDWKRGKDSKMHKDRTGEKFITRQGYEVEIIKYTSAEDCEYQFLHDTSFTLKSSYSDISKGGVSYPYHKTVLNVGYLGIGKHKGGRDKNIKKYDVWHGILQRCYDKKVHERRPNYIGCTVDERWHNFQVFGDWYEENWKPYMDGWELDKDIILKGNKIYSPETCAFVPNELNLLFTKNKARRGDYPIGVFLDSGRFRAVVTMNKVQKYFGSHTTPEEAFKASKEAKENYIKEKAEEWKPLIDHRVYNSMYNYQVEITD